MQTKRNRVPFILCSVKTLFFSNFPMQIRILRQELVPHEGTSSHYNSCIFYFKDFDLIWILESSSLRITALRCGKRKRFFFFFFLTELFICRPNIPLASHPDLLTLTQIMTPVTSTRRGITLAAHVYVSPSYFSIKPLMES